MSSSMIDNVVRRLGHDLREVPVGFKWFVPGLLGGSYCLGGEESAGASFLRRDGTVWTTDKDGLIMDLAGEPITAKLMWAPGNNRPVGGLRVLAKSDWFAVRPSGTEYIYKIYAESFKSEQHLNSVAEVQKIVNNALHSSAAGRQ